MLQSYSDYSLSYMQYFALACVVIPGFVLNSAALIFIIKDIRKAVFPAIILLLMLCSSDLAALIFDLVHISVSFLLADVTYTFAFCAVKSVPHTFFQQYSGVLNAMMSVDRVMAICFPFFYKRNVQVSTWKFGSLAAAFCTAMFNMFPVIGLGDVIVSVRYHGQLSYRCSTFTYWPEPRKRVFGTLYGIFGCIIVLTIFIGNSMVIRSALKMRSRITPSTISQPSATDSSISNTANVKSAEITFAKLMGCLALVYLTCGTPFNVLILLQQFPTVKVELSVKGAIHFLGGLSYSVDPIVYILVRKTRRNRLIMYLRCRCKIDEPTA